MDTGKCFPRGEADHSAPSGPEVKENATGCLLCHIHGRTALSCRKPESASTSAATAVLRDIIKEIHVHGCL